MYSDTALIKRLREEIKSLSKQRNDLKAENKKLRNLLIKINGITMREIYDDQL